MHVIINEYDKKKKFLARDINGKFQQGSTVLTDTEDLDLDVGQVRKLSKKEKKCM